MTTSAAPRRVAWRLAGYYGAVFGAGGVLLPFWPSWLGAQGLGASEIGVLLAAAMVARILATPLIARVADTTGERKRLVVLLCLASLACWALFPVVAGFWMLLIVGVLAQGSSAASMPLVEDMTLGAVRASTKDGAQGAPGKDGAQGAPGAVRAGQGLEYGRIRLVGSITFLLAAALGGVWLAGRAADQVLVLMIAGAAWVFVAALLLPDLRPTERLSIDLVGGLRTVLTRPGFPLLFLAAGLIQASHMVYYGFGTLQWRAAGLSDGFIGVLWAEGVVAEIVLFWLSAPLLRRLTPAGLMLLGGAAGALRWALTGLTADPAALLALQVLHGFTFGATHLGAMHYLRDHSAPGLTATAQGLHSALPMGALGGLTMLASGPLYGAFGAGAYQAMALMALNGGAIAWRLLQKPEIQKPEARD